MTEREIREVNKFRALFPSQISVSITRAEEGTFVAHIDTFPGVFTEGSTFSELMEMVNDAVKTYYEVPESFVPYMPSYVPSIQVAQALDVFPVRGELKESVTIPLAIGEDIAR